MKALIYVLAILGIGAGAYFSNASKQALDAQFEKHQEVVDSNRRVQASIDKTKTELDDENTKLTGANETLAEVDANISKLKSDQASLTREISTVEGDIEEQKAELDKANRALTEVQRVFQELDIPGDVNMDTIQENVKSLTDRQKELAAEVDELNSTIESTEKSIVQNRDEITRLARRKSERDRRMSRNSMSSIVTGVDQNYGFVIVGAGTNSGFKPQSKLIVTRNGRRIAEVTPSSVEATQTVAEIDFDTLAPGVVIQPGDRVILSAPATN
ncbi:hypothetical protein [Haloferula sargassicola]|uniref:Chromosome partition protein Smc n=1 Tax=Haloferula sargassicola TaxID=490096 RepID=A0ABP9UH40_9BACT